MSVIKRTSDAASLRFGLVRKFLTPPVEAMLATFPVLDIRYILTDKFLAFSFNVSDLILHYKIHYKYARH